MTLTQSSVLSKAAVRLLVMAVDAASIAGAWLLYYFVRRHVLQEIGDGVLFQLVGSTATITAIWMSIYLVAAFYVDVLRKSRLRELLNVVIINVIGTCLLMAAIITDVLFISNEDITNYRGLYRGMLMYMVIHTSLLLLTKLLVLSWTKYMIRTGKLHFRTLLVGNNPQAWEAKADLEQNSRHLGLHFIGFVDAPHSVSGLEPLPYLGNVADVRQIAKNHGIEQAILALEGSDHKTLERALNELDGGEVRVGVLPDMYQILIGSVRVSHMLGTPLIEVRHQLMPYWQQVAKRSFDVMVSALVLLIGFPMFAFFALMTKYSSPGPVFFRQERIGKGGLPFLIIKFRSMYIDAERFGPALSSGNDPRITPWGRIMRKTRIDELPQFWNVLVGDMSLVGPRPERQYFIDKIMEQAPNYRHLHRVRPGITSLGQVKFGYAENVEQMVRRMKYDILYIENMSLAMDLKILVYTVFTVLGARGK